MSEPRRVYKNLIATHFRYSMLDTLGDRQEHDGSYLGRKVASMTTLVRFLRRNGREWKPRLITVGVSYRTHWIYR